MTNSLFKLSVVSKEIRESNIDDANQMRLIVNREFMNSLIAFDDMTKSQQTKFEVEILAIFLYRNLGITANLLNNSKN